MAQPLIKFAALDEVCWGDDCIVHLPSNLYRCRIGSRTRIGPFVEIQDGCIIGADCVIASHSFIAAGTMIGDRVFIGHGVRTCNDRYPRANNPHWQPEPPTIGANAVIGSSATILPGVRIGAGALVGAGMIVTKDVAPGACVYDKQTVRSRRMTRGRLAMWLRNWGRWRLGSPRRGR